MYITIVIVTLSTAIVVFFSQEFSNLFRKVFAIPGVKLLLPLLVASWLVEYFEDLGLWLLLRGKEVTHAILHKFANFLPLQISHSIAVVQILHLFILACIPVWILHAMAKRDGKDMDEPWPSSYQLGMVIWLVIAILLTVHHP